MTAPQADTSSRSLSDTFRIGLMVSGIVAAVVGLLILIWPGHTAAVVTAMIAVYAIVTGLVYVGLGIFASTLGGWGRVGHIILGVLFIVGGVLALTRLGAATAALFLFVGILVGILWIIEGVGALMSLGSARFKVPTVIFAILSIVVGILLLSSPFYSVVLWIWLGIALLVLGIMQIVRSATWSRRRARRGADSAV